MRLRNIILVIIAFIVILKLISNYSPFYRKTVPFDMPQYSQKSLTEGGSVEYKLTLIEISSATCPPCKSMIPVLKEIEKEYPDVRVKIFNIQEPGVMDLLRNHSIRAVPTQVFLDMNGREYFRHLGFFRKEEIEDILAKGGVEIQRDDK